MTHHIRQQFFDIEFTGTTDEGLVMQRELPELYYAKLLPAIEKAFDQAFPSNRLIKIDRLDIDAGTIPHDRLDSDLQESVIKALLGKIREKGLDKVVVDGEENAAFVEIRAISDNLADAFVYFLKTGTLPWSYSLPAGKSLEDEIQSAMKDWTEGHARTKILTEIRNVLTSKEAVKRLGYQFSFDFRKQLLNILSIEIANAVDEILKNLRQEAIKLGIANQFGDRLLAVAFSYLSENNKPDSAGLRSFFKDKILIEPSLEDTIRNHPEIINIDNESITMDEEIETQSQSEPESYYINNAGMAILHPFLVRLFEHLGISSENRLVYPGQALGLLQHLATGQLTAPEYELVLPKILCGLPLNTPVKVENEINENEAEESKGLLNAVINHWKALGNTSVEGLRESFLLRQGKLSRKADGDWLLQVESKAFDILLGQLPWSVSMIQLPWMKQILWVEWSF